MYTKKRLTRSAALLALSAAAVLVQGTAVASSEVPADWNVAPFTSGAYLEPFTGQPAWAPEALALVDPTDSHVDVNVPTRANVWFGTTTQALKLNTGDASIANTFVYKGSSTKVSFATKPVFADMRVKFVAMPDETPPIIGDAKLAVYVNSTGTHLKIARKNGTESIAASDLTTKWHQLTIRMDAGAFDVLLDDATVATDLVPIDADTDLNSISFAGTGYIDDLYVSHGDPKYAIAGPTSGAPTLAGPHSRSDEEQTKVNVWLSTYLGINPSTVLSMTQDQLSSSYLLNVLGGNSTTALPVTPTFGVDSFDIVTPGTLHVVLKLLTGVGGNSVTINGKIQLQGKAATNDTWADVGAPFAATFVSGYMTPANFTGVDTTYRLFRARIVAP